MIEQKQKKFWWQQSALLAALALLTGLPVLFTSLPPLNDLLGHIGRYHVQLTLAENPTLQAYWSFKWSLVGNLGVDLLIIPLAPLFGLERALWLIALALPPLMVWGMIRVAKAVHGAVPVHTLFAFPLAAAFPYQFGFLNFWLSLMLALHAYASWVVMTKRGAPALYQALTFLPVGCVIWLCHLYGWALFALMAGATLLVHFWQRRVAAWPGMVFSIAIRIWPMLIPAFLVLLWQQAGEAQTLTTGYFVWDRKWQDITMLLRDQSRLLDLASVLLLALAIGLGLVLRRFRLDQALLLILAIFLVFQIVLPIQLQGSAYADTRLWPITFMAALLAIGPASPGEKRVSFMPEGVLALIAMVLLLSRALVGSWGFAAYGRAYASHLKALDQVAPGSKLVALVGLNCPDNWRKSRIEHLPSLGIARRDLFTNTQWAIAGGQLLTPIYATGTGWDRDPSQFVGHWHDCRQPMGAMMAARYAQIPRALFDYLWLLDVDPDTLPPLPETQLLYRDDRSALYRLLTPQPQQMAKPTGRSLQSAVPRAR